MRFWLGLVFLLFCLVNTSDGYYHKLFKAILRKKLSNTCPMPARCRVKLLANERYQHCKEQRRMEIARNRVWYQLTDETKPKTIEFPLTKVPWLNQTLANVQYHYAVDKDEGRYTVLLYTWRALFTKLNEAMKAELVSTPINTFSLHSILQTQRNSFVKNLKTPEFSNPSMESTFTEQITNDAWMNNEAFTQRRVAGFCPFLLQKVTKSGEVGIKGTELAALLNKEVLNNTFKMDVGNGQKITLLEAIEEERLFVMYNKEMDNFPTSPDLTDTNPNDERVLRNLSSTISLFVLKNDGILGVVAIQWDSKPDSKVFLPSGPPLEWAIAKAQDELIFQSMCQAGIHLGGIHLASSVFCFAFKRHFSSNHPLYDIFKFHCEGTTPHITTTWVLLIAPNSTGETAYSIGSSGYARLSFGEFQKRYYGNFDLDNLMMKRGLDDDRIKYYPFREDSKLILEELKRFSKEVVNKYYGRRSSWRHGRHFHDDRTSQDQLQDEENEAIIRDSELQSYVNEISADGTGPNGGLGKFPKFPSKFKTSKDLETFLVRFLWYNVIHTAVNYQATPEYVPLRAGKLYTRKNGEVETLAEIYPGYLNSANAVTILTAGTLLGSFRANRLMDYADKVRDNDLAKIVRASYNRLHNCIQKKLEKRNAERKAAGRLGYQYLEPKYITNSVHI